jgi:hypothetical protein
MRKPLVLVAGRMKELAASDTLAALSEPRTLTITGDTTAQFSQLATFLDVTGTLSEDAVLTLPTPDVGSYIVQIKNRCAGGKLRVKKGSGTAYEIRAGKRATVTVNA